LPFSTDQSKDTSLHEASQGFVSSLDGSLQRAAKYEIDTLSDGEAILEELGEFATLLKAKISEDMREGIDGRLIRNILYNFSFKFVLKGNGDNY
jgi:hypothetical protein